MEQDTLRDGTVAFDKRLDRLVQFDEQSRNFSIMMAIGEQKKHRSYTWRCMLFLDQGREGACVSAGIGHEAAARPAEMQGLTMQYLKEAIYWQAQREDPWEGGSYPGARPFYEGTSVLAGVKVAQRLGWFDSYRWAFSLEELILGVGYHGPAVIGVPWLKGMFTPDRDGYIHATGSQLGGHCTCVRGVDIKRKRFLIRNSWGMSWGINGDCFISFDDMDKLIHMNGEVVFFINRHQIPRPLQS